MAEYGHAVLGKPPQKTQAEFEAEPTIENLLQQELGKVRLANLGPQVAKQPLDGQSDGPIFKNQPTPQNQVGMHGGKTLEETTAGSGLAAEMKKPMDKHGSVMKETKNLEEQITEAIAARALEAEQTKMKKEMTKREEQKKALANGDEAKTREGEAVRLIREQGAEFDRRVKETEERANKLKDEHSSEMKDLKEGLVAVIAAKDEALKELEAEQTKMQREMTKWQEQKKALADGLTAAREEAKTR